MAWQLLDLCILNTEVCDVRFHSLYGRSVLAIGAVKQGKHVHVEKTL